MAALAPPPPAPAGMTQGGESGARVLPKPATQASLAQAHRFHGGAADVPDAAAGPEVQCPELQLRGSRDAAPTRGALPICGGGEPARRICTLPGAAAWRAAPYAPSSTQASLRGTPRRLLGVGRGVQ